MCMNKEMSCFWTSILQACRKYKLIAQSNIDDLCKNVIKMNTITDKVLYNGVLLKRKLLEENFEAVKNYNPNGMRNGHLVCFEHFFCLLVSNSTIIFNFNGHEMGLMEDCQMKFVFGRIVHIYGSKVKLVSFFYFQEKKYAQTSPERSEHRKNASTPCENS